MEAGPIINEKLMSLTKGFVFVVTDYKEPHDLHDPHDPHDPHSLSTHSSRTQ